MKKYFTFIAIFVFSLQLSAQNHFLPTNALASDSAHKSFMEDQKAEAQKRANLWKVPPLTVQIIASVQSGAGTQNGFNYGAVLPFSEITKYSKYAQTDRDGLVYCEKRSRGIEAIAVALKTMASYSSTALNSNEDYLHFVFGEKGELSSMALEAEKAYSAYTGKNIRLSPREEPSVSSFVPLREKNSQEEEFTEKSVPETKTLELESEELKRLRERNRNLEEKMKQAEETRKEIEKQESRLREQARIDEEQREAEKSKKKRRDDERMEIGQEPISKVEKNETPKIVKRIQAEGWEVVAGATIGTVINDFDIDFENYDGDELPVLEDNYFAVFAMADRALENSPNWVYGFSAEGGIAKKNKNTSIHNSIQKNEQLKIFLNTGFDFGYQFSISQEDPSKMKVGARGILNISPKDKLLDDYDDVIIVRYPKRLSFVGFIQLKLKKITIEINGGSHSHGLRIGYNF
jgi:hypothetical protein